MMRFRGDSLSEFYGVDSEIGQLRTVLVHRPGAELRRVTPQHTCGMLLPALPWAERAQAEHDAFTAALRSRGVEGLYLTELVQDALGYAPGMGGSGAAPWCCCRRAGWPAASARTRRRPGWSAWQGGCSTPGSRTRCSR